MEERTEDQSCFDHRQQSLQVSHNSLVLLDVRVSLGKFSSGTISVSTIVSISWRKPDMLNCFPLSTEPILIYLCSNISTVHVKPVACSSRTVRCVSDPSVMWCVNCGLLQPGRAVRARPMCDVGC